MRSRTARNRTSSSIFIGLNLPPPPPIRYLFPPIRRLFAPVRHLFPPARHLFPPVPHLCPPVEHLFPPVRHLFPPVRHLFPPVRHLFPPCVGKYRGPDCGLTTGIMSAQVWGCLHVLGSRGARPELPCEPCRRFTRAAANWLVRRLQRPVHSRDDSRCSRLHPWEQ